MNHERQRMSGPAFVDGYPSIDITGWQFADCWKPLEIVSRNILEKEEWDVGGE